MLHRRRCASLVVLLALASCQKCQSERKLTALERIPAQAPLAIELSQLGVAAASVKALQGFAQSSAQESQAQVDELKATLGFDPTSVEGLQSAGLAAKGSIAAAIVPGSQTIVLVLPIADAQLFDTRLRALAQRLWRADKITEERFASLSGLRVTRSFGDREIVLAGVVIDKAQGQALLAFGAEYRSSLEAIVAVKAQDSLAQSQMFKQACDKVPQGPWTLWVADSAEAKVPKSLNAIRENVQQVIARIGVAPGGLWIEALATLTKQAREQKIWRFDAEKPNIVSTARADSIAVFAGNADLSLLVQTAQSAQVQGSVPLDKLLKESGIDFNQEILSRLKGGLGAAIAFGEVQEIAAELKRVRGLPRSLGKVARVQMLAELTDTGVNEIVPIIDRYFEQRGMSVEKIELDGVSVHRNSVGVDKSARAVHYAVKGSALVLAVDEREQFESFLKRLRGDKSTRGFVDTLPTALRSRGVPAKGVSMILSFSSLADKIRELSATPAMSEPTAAALLAKASGLLQKLDVFALDVAAEEAGVRMRVDITPAAVTK